MVLPAWYICGKNRPCDEIELPTKLIPLQFHFQAHPDMSETIISSLQNTLVKQVVKLQQKAQERKKQEVFVVEGRRECALALKAGNEPLEVFYCPELFAPMPEYPVDLKKYNGKVRQVSRAVYNKMAYRQDSEGVLMTFSFFSTQLTAIQPKANPLILALEGVEKPGNLGAILRTADAASADAVVICDPLTDVFNPNVIRSSLGCCFTQQIAVCKPEEFRLWCQQNNIRIMIASVQSDHYYFNANLNQPLAMVFGTESQGLSQQWYQWANEKLKIPMLGSIDSLNVSASAAIMTFEAVRQRSSG